MIIIHNCMSVSINVTSEYNMEIIILFTQNFVIAINKMIGKARQPWLTAKMFVTDGILIFLKKITLIITVYLH